MRATDPWTGERVPSDADESMPTGPTPDPNQPDPWAAFLAATAPTATPTTTDKDA